MIYPDSDDLVTLERHAYINGDTKTAALLAHIIDAADETETHEETLGKVYDAAASAETHADAIGELLDQAEGSINSDLADQLRADDPMDRETALQEFIESVRAELAEVYKHLATCKGD